MTTNLTPADHGLLAVALDDALTLGLSDDGIVDHIASALMGEGEDQQDAASIAYDYWHNRGRA